MTHTEHCGGRKSPGRGLSFGLQSAGAQNHGRQDALIALVHVVEVDDSVRLPLSRWLAAAGMETRMYGSPGEFLSKHCAELSGCLVIDAKPLNMSGLEPQTILSSLVTRCPIVVTARQADVGMAVRAMKTGAIDFVEKPLREGEIVAAVCAAVDIDRRQRLVASRYAELHARFATLSPRERQVMALVTAGKLNKQVGADLGLSEITIKAHRGAAMRKMSAQSLADLVRMADAIGDALVRAGNDCSTPARTYAAGRRRTDCDPIPG